MGKENCVDTKEAFDVLKSITEALACGVACMGMFRLMDGYENDDPEAKEQGVKQILAGASMAALSIPADVDACFKK